MCFNSLVTTNLAAVYSAIKSEPGISDFIKIAAKSNHSEIASKTNKPQKYRLFIFHAHKNAAILISLAIGYSSIARSSALIRKLFVSCCPQPDKRNEVVVRTLGIMRIE